MLKVPELFSRRSFVKHLMDKGVSVKETIRLTRLEFPVSYASVLADINSINNANLPYGCMSAKGVKLEVLRRDNFTCQYCGSSKNEMTCVEHVVPSIFERGVDESFNLVCACMGCNVSKGQSVWIPQNIDLITEDNPGHREYIIYHSVKDCRTDHFNSLLNNKPNEKV